MADAHVGRGKDLHTELTENAEWTEQNRRDLGEGWMRQGSGSEYRGNEISAAWGPGIGSHAGSAGLTVIDLPSSNTASVVAEGVAAYGPFEWVALGYLAISSALILVLAGNLEHPLRVLSVQVLVALVILALCRAEANVWSPHSTATMAGRKWTAPSARLGAGR